MTGKRLLRKTVDDKHSIRCAAGPGQIREEVWTDGQGKVVRYNMAFINHYLGQADNGRVLGYDNAHGKPHRHFKGTQTPIDDMEYGALYERLLDEVSVLREETL